MITENTQFVGRESAEILLVGEDAIERPSYDERLAKGIKVVVMGPPHSGKSVFIDSLMRHLDSELNATMLSGCPDGEGLWLQRYYDDPEVASLRRKGAFTHEFVQFARQSVENFENPLAIVDIGGRVSDENRQIAAGATHAIILAGDLSMVAEWRAFAEELDIEVVAKLHSHYSADHDTILKTDDVVVASTHHLERGTSDEDRPSIAHVAELLNRLVNNNVAYWQRQAEKRLAADEVEIVPRELAKALGRSEHVRTLPNGQEVKAIEFEPSDARALYDMMNGMVESKTVKVDGFVKGWEFTAITFAALANGAADVEQNSPNGYVTVRTVEIADRPTNGFNLIVQERDDGVFIDVQLDGPITPEQMDGLAIPAVTNDRVIISGKIPHWLRASIAVSYAEKCDEVAIFTPGEGNTVVWAKDQSKIGQNYA